MVEELMDLFMKFIQNPTADAFHAIRSRIVAHEAYVGFCGDMLQMEEAYREKRYSDMKRVVKDSFPSLLLSPGAHLLLSMATREEGNAQRADAEKLLWFYCLRGIQLTGDGTREKPYHVLHLSDEYDLLKVLGKTRVSQCHVEGEDGARFDCLKCDDGSEVWFDITYMANALNRRLEGQ